VLQCTTDYYDLAQHAPWLDNTLFIALPVSYTELCMDNLVDISDSEHVMPTQESMMLAQERLHLPEPPLSCPASSHLSPTYCMPSCQCSMCLECIVQKPRSKLVGDAQIVWHRSLCYLS
jgi:hypothetical protein